MKKILIIGSTGLFGVNFISKLKNKYILICNEHKRKLDFYKNSIKINFFKKKDIKEKINLIKPDIILNCSGLTDLKKCEKNKKLAYKANYLIIKNLCDVIKSSKIKLIHISTDHLFNGIKETYYSESDIKNPLNTYSLTKSLSEDEIRKKIKNYLIIRTNFFGWGTSYRNSITDYIIKNLILKKKVFLSNKIMFNPIYLGNLIDCVKVLIERNQKGFFNLSTNLKISKFQFGKKIADIFNLDKNLIFEHETNEVNKPKNMALSIKKAKKIFEKKVFDLDQNIKNLKNDFEKKNIKEFYEFLPYGRHHLFKSDIEEINSVLHSNNLTQGPKIDEFESKIAKYVGAKYAVAVSSCSAGLHLACKVVGLNKTNKFITSPNTFVSTSNAGLHCGAKVLFCDIDLKSGNLDFLKLKKMINKEKKIKAILPVHFSGAPFDSKKLKLFLKNKNINIIEDAAHALGSKYEDGNMVGSCKNCDMTVFSFHPVKSIACGEGGIVTTNNKEYYEKLKILRTHGISKSPIEKFIKSKQNIKSFTTWYYEMQELGFHYRLTDIQAALGISQLKSINKFLKKREKLAVNYDQKLNKINNIKILNYKKRKNSSNHIYVILIDFKKMKISRTEFMKKLLYLGIGSQLHYIPVFLHPYYKKRENRIKIDYKNSLRYYDTALSIPLYYDLKFNEQNKVIETLQQLAK